MSEPHVFSVEARLLVAEADIREAHDDIRELQNDVKEIPLLRQDVERYAESWKAMRTALYAVAATILGSALFILLHGAGGVH